MSEPAESAAPYTPDTFNAMFAASDDPWQFRSRWYEARKRALTLACLPARRYASVYEPGCANGELTALLAERCDRLLATDGVARAVGLARERVAEFAHVAVRQAWLPDDWPTADRFDLVVVSELGYFLDATALATLAQRLLVTLQPGGTVLAVHWRRPISGCTLTGDAVHAQLHTSLGLPRLLEVVDDDLRLDVWCLDARSVGEREGLT